MARCLLGLPTKCACGHNFSVDQCFLLVDILATLRHNELRDFTAVVLSGVLSHWAIVVANNKCQELQWLMQECGQDLYNN